MHGVKVPSFRTNEALMRLSLVNHGPLAVGFEVYDDLMNYHSGVYHHTGVTDKLNRLNKWDPFQVMMRELFAPLRTRSVVLPSDHQSRRSDCGIWCRSRHQHPILDRQEFLGHRLGRARLLPYSTWHRRMWHRKLGCGDHADTDLLGLGSDDDMHSVILLITLSTFDVKRSLLKKFPSVSNR